MEEGHPAPRSDILLLGGMRDQRSSSMRFTQPHGHDSAPLIPPRRTIRSTAPPPYKPKMSEYVFTILSKQEEERLMNLRGRLRANINFRGWDFIMISMPYWRTSVGNNFPMVFSCLSMEKWQWDANGDEDYNRRIDYEDVSCLDFRLKMKRGLSHMKLLGSYWDSIMMLRIRSMWKEASMNVGGKLQR